MKKKSARVRRLRPTGRCLDVPFAITNEGVVLVNAMGFDHVSTTDDALRRALREPSRLFIGIALEADEVKVLLEHLRDVVNEPAGFIIGGRQRRTGR